MDPSSRQVLDRQELTRQLDLELERAKRGSQPLSILIGELHGANDASATADPAAPHLLESAATLLLEEKRQMDIAGQLDGGKLALVLPGTGEHGAFAVAERLRAAVVVSAGEQAAPPTLNFGVASFGRHGRSSADLFRAAEQGLVAAQMLGRADSTIDAGAVAAAIASIGDRNAQTAGQLETMLSLAETVDVRDRGTAGHSQTVGRYAKLIAREFDLSPETVERIRIAGLLRDIGKVGVPRSVLQKRDSLTSEEWETVKKHPEIGARILEGSEFDDIREWVFHHHERPDGEGYPNGLRGKKIPLAARMIAVAEAYEAMTSDRPHRPAASHAKAQEELTRCSGTQFDRRVVDAFLRLLERQGLRHPARTAA